MLNCLFRDELQGTGVTYAGDKGLSTSLEAAALLKK
jgi:hypothetical protein